MAKCVFFFRNIQLWKSQAWDGKRLIDDSDMFQNRRLLHKEDIQRGNSPSENKLYQLSQVTESGLQLSIVFFNKTIIWVQKK